ncbi:hypothetical protein ACN3XK_74415 [Actinomadura welshii]
MPGKESHQVPIPAWLDPTASTLFVSAPDEAGRARSGGYAIASLFDTNPRDVAHAWVVAWSEAKSGTQAELVVSAAERAAEEQRRRDASQAALLDLPGTGNSTQKPQAETKPKKNSTLEHSAKNQPPVQTTRILVNPETLVLRKPEGEIVTGAPSYQVSRGAEAGPRGKNTSGNGNLREPNRNHPRKLGGPGRGPLNYTAEERETVGLELLRQVLADEDTILTDVRHQPNVGADAVDNHGRYYELKVSAGALPDTVKLEDSQIQRAFITSDKFYLVLVGNVEAGQGNPEVRIIHDPLHHLKPAPYGAIHLKGALSVHVARSWIFSSSEEISAE